MDGARTLTALALLFSAASAFEIHLSAPAEVLAFENWQIKAFVVNDSTNVSYPDCTLSIYKGGENQGDYGMDAGSEYAYLTLAFGEAGTYSAVAHCTFDGDVNSSETGLEVEPNAQLHFDISGGNFVGDTLTAEADYRDTGGSDITSGSCTFHLYREGELQSSQTSYYSSDRGLYYWSTTVMGGGDHRLEATCYASEHSEMTDSKTFGVSKLPVTIEPSTTSVSGKYSETKTVSLTVSPSTAGCSTNYGTLSRPYSNRYTLTVPLNFLGEKRVTVTCSAPQYTSGSRSLVFESRERETKLSISLSTKKPRSFQEFRVTPQYYEADWNTIRGADCTVSLGEQSRQTESFRAVSLEAPAGPAEAQLEISCSKRGYQEFQGTTTVEVEPIDVTGELEFPRNAKKEEPARIRVLLTPAVNADCTLQGELNSLENGGIQDYHANINLRDSPHFTLTADEPGTLDFDINCSLAGYTGFEDSGQLVVTTFSRTEEIQATIILTTLTIILAVGFMLVRRWM